MLIRNINTLGHKLLFVSEQNNKIKILNLKNNKFLATRENEDESTIIKTQHIDNMIFTATLCSTSETFFRLWKL